MLYLPLPKLMAIAKDVEDMAHFYFGLEADGFRVIDEQGDNFCSLDEAIEHAKAVAAELAHRNDRDGERLCVLDEGGTIVWQIPISGALPERLWQPAMPQPVRLP
jgi:hypothetical protein